MKFKCEFQDFTGPEKSGLDAIMVDEKGGRALGLSTRHIREIQACWKVPGQGQKRALVLHVPEACRAECIPKGDQESPHACATPTHHAAGSNRGDHLHGEAETCCLHPSIPGGQHPPPVPTLATAVLAQATFWLRRADLEGHEARTGHLGAGGREQAGGGNLMTCTCLPRPGVRLG